MHQQCWIKLLNVTSEVQAKFMEDNNKIKKKKTEKKKIEKGKIGKIGKIGNQVSITSSFGIHHSSFGIHNSSFGIQLSSFEIHFFQKIYMQTLDNLTITLRAKRSESQ